jgi:uncharacterized membrane protein
MQFDYPAPWWALTLVALTVIAVAWYAYAGKASGLDSRKRSLLMALRAAALLLLILMLFRPTVASPPDSRSDAMVAVLVDTSRSMLLSDTDEGRRIDRAGDLLERLLPALSRSFETHVFGFGDVFSPLDPSALSATASRTDLVGALAAARERLRGQAVAGIVVLSDGGDTGDMEPESVVAGRIPHLTVGIGHAGDIPDREVLGISAGEVVLAESVLDLSVSVMSRGLPAEPLDIRLLADGNLVDTRQVVQRVEGSPLNETFSISPSQKGPTLYTVEVPAADGEVTTENNRRSIVVAPPSRKRRVLFLQGAPGFDHAFIKRALDQDPGLEVDLVVRKGHNEAGQPTYYVQAAASRIQALGSGFPSSREALFDYDAVLAGSMEWHLLGRDQLQMLADFVGHRGGGLLVMGARSLGSRALAGTAVAEVLPAAPGAERGVIQTSATSGVPGQIVPNEAAARHPILRLASDPDENARRWAGMPSLAAVVPLGQLKPGASLLATARVPGGSRPLIAIQRYGQGRSMVFAGEASWRWKMLLPSTDTAFETFWRQTVRWLSSGSPDALTMLPVRDAVPGRDLVLDVVVRDGAFRPVRDASVSVRVVAPDGRVHELEARLAEAATGRYSARVPVEQAGVHNVVAEASRRSAALGRAEHWFLAGGADMEFSDPRLNDELLRRIAVATKGAYFHESDVGELLRAVGRLRAGGDATERRDVWNQGWVLGLVVLMLGTEWTLRRRWGLR